MTSRTIVAAMNTAKSAALIINTYEQPDYLARVLAAVALQSRAPDEVVLADDGSGEATRRLFAAWASSTSWFRGKLPRVTASISAKPMPRPKVPTTKVSRPIRALKPNRYPNM